MCVLLGESEKALYNISALNVSMYHFGKLSGWFLHTSVLLCISELVSTHRVIILNKSNWMDLNSTCKTKSFVYMT